MLNNFYYHLYTQFYFGTEAENNVGEAMKKDGAKKVLIIYGSDRIKKDGLFKKITDQLDKQEITYFELGGVQANPRLSLIRKGIEIAKKENIDYLLAIGGGSAIDTAKAIGVGNYVDGDVWQVVFDKSLSKKVLPVAVVLTYPAAGSESSKSCVVTNDEVTPNIKGSFPGYRPRLAFENPELSFTLPEFLTAAGIADMYMHIWERYFSPVNFGSMDYMAEGMLKCIIDLAPKILANPTNYEYRAEIMWLSTMAHNDTCGNGRPQDWATHGLGHELSAAYDTTHGVSLTVIGPAWMKYVYKDNLARFARYAKEVFGIDEADQEKASLLGIEATVKFFKSLGLPTNFKEANLPTDMIEHMANQVHMLKGGDFGCMKPLTVEDCINIYKIAADLA